MASIRSGIGDNMTESEAIKEVRFNMSKRGLSDKAAKRVVEARDVAIKALEKQEKIKEVFTHYDFYGCEFNVNDYISALSEIKAILKQY